MPFLSSTRLGKRRRNFGTSSAEVEFPPSYLFEYQIEHLDEAFKIRNVVHIIICFNAHIRCLSAVLSHIWFPADFQGCHSLQFESVHRVDASHKHGQQQFHRNESLQWCHDLKNKKKIERYSNDNSKNPLTQFWSETKKLESTIPHFINSTIHIPIHNTKISTILAYVRLGTDKDGDGLKNKGGGIMK